MIWTFESSNPTVSSVSKKTINKWGENMQQILMKNKKAHIQMIPMVSYNKVTEQFIIHTGILLIVKGELAINYIVTYLNIDLLTNTLVSSYYWLYN